MNEETNTATMSGAACLDLLTMARGWPAAEWTDTPDAELWAYTLAEVGGLTGTQCAKVGTHGDIYALLDDAGALLRDVRNVVGLALVTWGWAAPVADLDEHAPSQHPERRRVRLAAVITLGEMLSRVTFRDTPEENFDDAGTGPLGDALAEAFAAVTR